MLAKTFNILRNNPLLIIFYIVYLAVTLAMTISLFPNNYVLEDPLSAVYVFGQVIVVSILLGIISLLFFSGYGHMLSEAVVNGNTSAHSFLPGIKKYFVRVLVTALLLIVFYIGFSIAVSIIMIPLSIILAVGSVGNPTASVALISTLFIVIIFVILLFVLPFVLLWYPAIFIDDVNSIEGLKRGARAGVKSYWKLVLAILVIYIPIILYFAIESPFDLTGAVTYSPFYYISIILSSLLSMILLPYIFVVYNEVRPQLVQIRP